MVLTIFCRSNEWTWNTFVTPLLDRRQSLLVQQKMMMMLLVKEISISVLLKKGVQDPLFFVFCCLFNWFPTIFLSLRQEERCFNSGKGEREMHFSPRSCATQESRHLRAKKQRSDSKSPIDPFRELCHPWKSDLPMTFVDANQVAKRGESSAIAKGWIIEDK